MLRARLRGHRGGDRGQAIYFIEMGGECIGYVEDQVEGS